MLGSKCVLFFSSFYNIHGKFCAHTIVSFINFSAIVLFWEEKVFFGKHLCNFFKDRKKMEQNPILNIALILALLPLFLNEKNVKWFESGFF